MLGDKVRRALRPDAQPFDEIKIVTEPRYKTSGMSGDEWRISAVVQFFRKRKKVFEKSFSTLEYACAFLPGLYATESCGGSGYYAGEGELCDQEGCYSPSTVTYKLKKEFCRQGHGTELKETVVRKFCDHHKARGDCGLEDADRNYEAL